MYQVHSGTGVEFKTRYVWHLGFSIFPLQNKKELYGSKSVLYMKREKSNSSELE